MEQQNSDVVVPVQSSKSASAVEPTCNGHTATKSEKGKDQPISSTHQKKSSYDKSLNGLMAVVVPSSASGHSPTARRSEEKKKGAHTASSLPTSSEGCGTHRRATSSASLQSERCGTGSSPRPHPRATSSASLRSEGRGPSSSSSSSSLELSTASSFNSKELMEQLLQDLDSASQDGEPLAKNHVVKQLLEHIISLKLELEQLKEENLKLREVRSNMDDELHTLTENLFEEAYKMVDTAKEEKGQAVKKLADAAGKIDAMETEMSALKNLLHAPPPTLTLSKSPSPHTKHKKPNVKKALRKLSRKMKVATSKSSVKGGASNSLAPPTHALLLEHKSTVKGACLEEGELDPNEFAVFSEWLSDVTQHDHPYLAKVAREDIQPCLSFNNHKVSGEVLEAVKNNQLLMETLSSGTTEEDKVCALSGCDKIPCTHRMQLSPTHPWLYISQHCRDRIAAVCDFYMFVSHIEKGILKQDATQLYWQVNRLRAGMNLARLTLQLPE